jgi:hypothetical protein
LIKPPNISYLLSIIYFRFWEYASISSRGCIYIIRQRFGVVSEMPGAKSPDAAQRRRMRAV